MTNTEDSTPNTDYTVHTDSTAYTDSTANTDALHHFLMNCHFTFKPQRLICVRVCRM